MPKSPAKSAPAPSPMVPIDTCLNEDVHIRNIQVWRNPGDSARIDRDGWDVGGTQRGGQPTHFEIQCKQVVSVRIEDKLHDLLRRLYVCLSPPEQH